MPAFDYRERRPPPALEPWLECSWKLTIDRRRPVDAHRVLPDGCIDLVWTPPPG